MKRIICISGASTGIGAATARELAKDNFIFIHYNSSEGPARKVLEDVKAAGGDGMVVQADLGSEEGCIKLAEAVEANAERLDVLVNNAGGLVERRPIDSGLPWDLMEKTFRINTFSAMYLTSRFLPLLKAGKDPSVITMTSIAVRSGAPSATIYSACKAALEAFTRGAARELAPEIRVNAIAPGVIETPFHDRYSTPERMVNFKESTPLKRNGQDHHIASAVRFLMENDFITGESIDVNGGLFIR
jgi:3-oxoacyl-[acyl-carrier protein] reductase